MMKGFKTKYILRDSFGKPAIGLMQLYGWLPEY